MWPTFYIPLALQADDLISGQPFKLCGVTPFANPITIPTPPEAITGGVQFVILDWVVSSGSTPVFPDASGPPWRRIFDANRVARTTATNFGSARQIMFWRYYTVGDPDLTISVTGGGGVQAGYTSIVLNNPNYADPWFTLYAHNFSANFNTPMRYEGASTMMEVANSGDLLVWCSASYTNGFLDPAAEPTGEDVEFACTVSFEAAGSGTNGHTMAALQSRARTVNNLLKYCPSIDPAGWSIVGLSRSTGVAIGTGCRGAVFLHNNTGTGRHYAEQTVSLKAGKTYGFFVEGIGYTTTNPEAVLWISYTKPDATEHGVGVSPSGDKHEITGSTEVRWDTGAGHPTRAFISGDNTNSFFGPQLGFLITPEADGDYTFRIYVLPGAFGGTPVIQPVVDSGPGNANCWFSISGVVLQEGPAVEQLPAFIPTGATPVLKGDRRGVLSPLPRLSHSFGNASGWVEAVMRRSGGTRPPCVLFSPSLRYGSFDFDDLTINDTSERHDNNVRGYLAIGTSHVVYEILSGQKYYLELYVDTYGTGAANDAYTIGFCVAEAMQDTQTPISQTGPLIGDSPQQYSYMSTGKTWTDGVQDGGSVAAWDEGDYIGAAIDFTNWQITFYRNGTLVKTQTITNDLARYALWRGQFGLRGPGTPDKQARFIYNFKGPFGGRKPSGFLAYDFDNEVT